MTDPATPYTNLFDASLLGWSQGDVRGKCGPAVYRIDGPDEKHQLFAATHVKK